MDQPTISGSLSSCMVLIVLLLAPTHLPGAGSTRVL